MQVKFRILRKNFFYCLINGEILNFNDFQFIMLNDLNTDNIENFENENENKENEEFDDENDQNINKIESKNSIEIRILFKYVWKFKKFNNY
jgi:hypothetical protein